MAYLRKRVGKGGKVRWEIVVSMGPDPQRPGKYRQKSFTVEGTKAEALRRAVELEREKESGVSLDARKLTVAEYLRRWLRHVRLSPSTYERYIGVVEQHLIPDIGSIPLTKLTPLHIQEMYDRQLEAGRKDNKKSVGRSLAPSTVAYHHRVLRRALKQAVKWRLIASNPCDAVEAPRQQRKEAAYLTEDQLRHVLKSLEGTYLYMPSFIAAMTGMRMGEVLGLRWQDVDLQGAKLHVRQVLHQRKQGEPLFKPPKTAAARRTIDLDDHTVAVLRRHRREQLKWRVEAGPAWRDEQGLVCTLQDGSPYHPPTLESVFRHAARKAGLAISFHCLRHTHASLLLKAGVPLKVVQERLGHASVNITGDIYAHVLPGMQKDAARQYARLVFGSDSR